MSEVSREMENTVLDAAEEEELRQIMCAADIYATVIRKHEQSISVLSDELKAEKRRSKREHRRGNVGWTAAALGWTAFAFITALRWLL